MKFWITKYALTTGIVVVEGQPDKEFPTMLKVDGYQLNPYYHRPHWHETKDAAILRAKEMREKKIKSLGKQLEKLLAMKFDV